MLDICRICMDGSIKLINIFGQDEEKPSLADMLNEFTNCQVQKDALPQHICSSCVLAAQNAYHFKRKCEQSYRQLLQLLKSEEKKAEEKQQVQTDSEDEEPIKYEQETEDSQAKPNQFMSQTSGKKECTMSHETLAELDAHIDQVDRSKPMLCPECGLRCKNSHTLIIHLRRHNGEKPYKCKFCSKGFPRLDDMRVHEKYHTGEKSHFCTICAKGFIRKYNLTIHMRVHTGERPYKCNHCPQAFAQANDLKSHIRRHTGERFHCECCQASFLQHYKLRLHKLAKHGIEEKASIQRLTKFHSMEKQQQQIKRNLEQNPTIALRDV